jgi:hypothetical protein
MSAGANYSGSAGNTNSLNGGTFLQSTAGVSGSYQSGFIGATIGTFGSAGSEQSGSVQILVNGAVSFALPIDFIDPGNNGIVAVGGGQAAWSIGNNLTNISLVGKTVSGRVSVNGVGPAALVTFSLSNPSAPPPPTGPAIIAPGVVFQGIINPGGQPSGPLGSGFQSQQIQSQALPPGYTAPSLQGEIDPLGFFIPPDNPPYFPNDPVPWPNASFSSETAWGVGKAIAAKQKQAREAFLMAQCPRVMLTQQFIQITASNATFPLAVLVDLQGTPDWIMLDFGLFNFNGAAANPNVGFRIYDNGSGTPGTVQATGTYQSGRPVWSGVCQGEQVVPWRLSKNCLIELVYISGSAPAASTLEFALSGYLDQ